MQEPAESVPDAAAGRRTARRRPAVLALLIVAGAVATVIAGGLAWWHQAHLDALAGTVTTTATGSQTDVLLVPAALAALAGFGAALATAGVLRRLVGLLLLIGGGATAVLAVVGAVRAPAQLVSSLARPAEYSSSATLQPIGAVLGVLGGLLIAVAGLLLVIGFGARRALGTRYDAPTSRRARAASPVSPAPSGDGVDPVADADASAQWWKALDTGHDPTDGSTTGRRAAAPSGTADAGMAGDAPRGG